jgi:uncharacterized phage protein (predicted DNA packaging)
MTLEQVKAHLRVTHNAEDTLIYTYMDAAEMLVEKHLGDDMPDPVPEPITAAMMLLTADLYTRRGRQSDRIIYDNDAYLLLLSPYRTTEVL